MKNKFFKHLYLNSNINKKGDVSILALVILSVILFSVTLYIFNVNSSKVINEINDARFLNNIYLKEQYIDFYVNEAIDKSLVKSLDKNSFILEFKNNLKLYDKDDILVRKDLLKIAEEIKDENVQYDEKLILNVKVQIVEKNRKIIASYNYDKQFVRIL
ncbi:MAG: hypothetical protein AABW83_01585 [Nanoarchaeota archaeon]